MFVEAVKKAQKAMFPIFRIEKLNPQQFQIGVAGTGFFVDDNGHFITVAHVFDNTTDKSSFKYLGLLPDGLLQKQVDIEKIAVDDENDIFLGRVAIPKSDFLDLSDDEPKIGRSICLSGYPLASLVPGPNNSIDVSGVRRYFQPSFVLDLAMVKSNNGLGKIRNHSGFMLRDTGLFGMSGGPVFDVEGNVLGIQGSVTDPRVSANADKSIAVINSIAIGCKIARELVAKHLKSK